MKLNLLFFVLFIAVFYSCDNNELIENQKQPQNVGKIEFTYQGYSFTSIYTILQDTVIWEDKKAGEVYQSLTNNPNLATVIDESGKILFYDNYDDYLSNVSDNLPKNQLRSSSTDIGKFIKSECIYGKGPVVLYLWANINKGGNCYISNLNIIEYYTNGVRQAYPSYTNLLVFNPQPVPYSTYNINDIISSFELVPYVYTPSNSPGSSIPNNIQFLEITLFQDINFKGKSITFSRNTKGSIYISDLSQYAMVTPNLFRHSKSWNDQVSSLKYRYQ